MTQFVCIGVPYFIGERIPARTEIDTLRRAGLADALGATWTDFTPNFADAPDPVTAVNRALARTIRFYPNALPLIFASDCMASLGALAGLAARHDDLAVIWFDAHGDFNTPETTPSGFLGGMPLAMIAGRGDRRYMDGVGLVPLPEADIILTDARDLDPPEAEALRASQIAHYPNLNALLSADLPDKPVYLHLDVDVIRLDDMPGMSYPAAGGPTLAETAAAVERVARDVTLAGVLFSLWNDSLVPGDSRPLAGVRALVAAIQRGLAASPSGG